MTALRFSGNMASAGRERRGQQVALLPLEQVGVCSFAHSTGDTGQVRPLQSAGTTGPQQNGWSRLLQAQLTPPRTRPAGCSTDHVHVLSPAFRPWRPRLHPQQGVSRRHMLTWLGVARGTCELPWKCSPPPHPGAACYPGKMNSLVAETRTSSPLKTPAFAYLQAFANPQPTLPVNCPFGMPFAHFPM
uniref:Uncharacterized protein n=1 Tax=Myotis myotis TaxID=51298 RepID=A0A7J7SR19_MYOMY|nr:hypothetical protein mMyoMyo1_009294 [Myotis myotis]